MFGVNATTGLRAAYLLSLFRIYVDKNMPV